MRVTVSILVLFVALTFPAIAQQKLPPLSYVCPMPGDEDVVGERAGTCPKCGMALVPIRLDTTWTCPVHGAVHRDKPGRCPIEGRGLIQMTMSVTWKCPGSPAESLQPGRCPDGSATAKIFTPRPHGNHNPQHGGQFFMAPDNWHHLEGTYPRAGVFRLYLYDDYTRPLPRAEQRQIAAQVVVGGRTFPLAQAPNRRYLEAKIGGATLPAALQAKVTFKAGGPQHVFDFSFEKYSKEPAPGTPVIANATTPASAAAAAELPARTATRAAAVVPLPAPAAASPAPAVTPSALQAGVDPALIPLPIPDTVPEMVAELGTRTDQIRALIDKGLFADVYVPAFQAKDLAIALAEHDTELAPERRRIAEPALSKLVRSAYLLDAFGDIGNKQQISAAFTQFAAASKAIVSAFPRRQP